MNLQRRCELLDWNIPAEKAKWHPCLEFLEELEAEGQIQLPPVKTKKPTSGKIKVTAIDFNTKEINGEVKNFEAIQLKVVQPGEELQRWRAYVEQYHMLGFKTVFGSRLQYIIKSAILSWDAYSFRHRHGRWKNVINGSVGREATGRQG